LRGTVNPNDGSTEGWFEYGTNDTLGLETVPQLIGNGNQHRNPTAPIDGLEPNVRASRPPRASMSISKPCGRFCRGIRRSSSVGRR
jgi:hypothetical protein